MRKILFISMCMPFEKAFHAGGKTFNYYINKFANDSANEVTLIAKVLPEEEEYVKEVNSNIDAYYVCTPKNKVKKYLSYVKSINSKFNPTYPYGNVLTKEIFDQIEEKLKQLKEKEYCPDIIVLEWTWMMLFIDKVKKYYPDAVYIASEHDVSFLGLERKKDNIKNSFFKYKQEIYYQNIKKRELQCINECDYVVTHNEKDRKLLLENNVNEERVGTITPYFEKPNIVKRNSNFKDIVFYGAMNRTENSETAIWFIKNVLPRLEDLDVRFVIIGNKPPEELKKLENARVEVTGFVDSVEPYFSRAMCLAAPLQGGAGIKVKILEAMAMGVPVITNQIGIEGIDAENGIHYFYCETPKEYETIIRKIYEKEIDAEIIAQNAVKMINDNYNLEKSFEKYSKKIYDLASAAKDVKNEE